MRYLKEYNLFESSEYNGDNYYIAGHHWDYLLGYIWSPKVIIGNGGKINKMFSSGRNDSNVVTIRTKSDGMSDTLMFSALYPLFNEYLGTSNLNDLCAFYLRSLGYDYGPMDEFPFLKDPTEKKSYVIIKSDQKDIVQQVDDFKGDYLDIVGKIIGYKFSDKEREDIQDGKDHPKYKGSWHVSANFYDIDGIRIISGNLAGTDCYILKRNDIEKLLDKTPTSNYYRFVDKDLQVERINGKKLEYNDIADIFVDITDNDANKIKMDDFHQINDNQVMIKFMTTNMIFDQDLVNAISDNINRFSSAYGFKFDRIDLTQNHMMYVNDSNKT